MDFILTDSGERSADVESGPESVVLDHVGGDQAARNAQAVGHGRYQIHSISSLNEIEVFVSKIKIYCVYTITVLADLRYMLFLNIPK